jgi:hypothetical protein
LVQLTCELTRSGPGEPCQIGENEVRHLGARLATPNKLDTNPA